MSSVGKSNVYVYSPLTIETPVGKLSSVKLLVLIKTLIPSCKFKSLI